MIPFNRHAPQDPSGPPDWVAFDPESDRFPDSLASLRSSLEPGGKLVVLAVGECRDADWAARAALRAAVLVGEGGIETLLIDLDIDGDGLGQSLRESPREGISDVVFFSCSIGHASRPTGDGAVSLVPAGTVVANPADVVEHPALAALLDDLVRQGTTVLVHVPVGSAGAEALVARADALVVLGAPTTFPDMPSAGFEGPVAWLGAPADASQASYEGGRDTHPDVGPAEPNVMASVGGIDGPGADPHVAPGSEEADLDGAEAPHGVGDELPGSGDGSAPEDVAQGEVDEGLDAAFAEQSVEAIDAVFSEEGSEPYAPAGPAETTQPDLEMWDDEQEDGAAAWSEATSAWEGFGDEGSAEDESLDDGWPQGFGELNARSESYEEPRSEATPDEGQLDERAGPERSALEREYEGLPHPEADEPRGRGRVLTALLVLLVLAGTGLALRVQDDGTPQPPSTSRIGEPAPEGSGAVDPQSGDPLAALGGDPALNEADASGDGAPDAGADPTGTGEDVGVRADDPSQPPPAAAQPSSAQSEGTSEVAGASERANAARDRPGRPARSDGVDASATGADRSGAETGTTQADAPEPGATTGAGRPDRAAPAAVSVPTAPPPLPMPDNPVTGEPADRTGAESGGGVSSDLPVGTAPVPEPTRDDTAEPAADAGRGDAVEPADVAEPGIAAEPEDTAAEAGPLNPDRVDRAEPVEPAPSLAPTATAPQPSATDRPLRALDRPAGLMAFALEIGMHDTFEAATSQAAVLQERHRNLELLVVPVSRASGLRYRVLAGPAASTAEAELIRVALQPSLSAEARRQAAVRSTGWAFLLGVFENPNEAMARVQTARSRNVPVSIAEVPVNEDRVVYRVYSGAYGSEDEATPLAALLEQAGLGPARLTERIGRPVL